jgi:hypothetical protein
VKVSVDLEAVSRRRDSRRRRSLTATFRSSLTSLVLLGLVATTGACAASGAREDLVRALQDTGAAIRTVGLAVDLLQHGQTTAAAAEVTARDMVDEIGQAQQQLVEVPGPTAELRSLRERAQLVITGAQIAVQDTEDVLAAGEDPAEAAARLAAADRAVELAVAAVGER